jgi:hypothetical protein
MAVGGDLVVGGGIAGGVEHKGAGVDEGKVERRLVEGKGHDSGGAEALVRKGVGELQVVGQLVGGIVDAQGGVGWGRQGPHRSGLEKAWQQGSGIRFH